MQMTCFSFLPFPLELRYKRQPVRTAISVRFVYLSIIRMPFLSVINSLGICNSA